MPPEHPNPAAPSEHSQPPPPPAVKGKEKLKKKEADDLSEEDLLLKEQLELYILRAQDSDPGVQKLALESMRKEIRSATSSMTSVPKLLKFLRPHYGTLKSYFETMPESEVKPPTLAAGTAVADQRSRRGMVPGLAAPPHLRHRPLHRCGGTKG